MADIATPRVPIQTPPFNERNDVTWTRTWIIFFEQIAKLGPAAGGGDVDGIIAYEDNP